MLCRFSPKITLRQIRGKNINAIARKYRGKWLGSYCETEPFHSGFQLATRLNCIKNCRKLPVLTVAMYW